MGFGFAILIHLIFLFILSAIVAFFSGIITYFISNKEKKKRRIFLSVFLPFHLFFSYYFFGIIGSVIVSEIKKVDIGFGDSWYAPIVNSYQILMIDLTDQAFIEFDGKTVLSEVSEIQQTGKNIICKTTDEKYYSINLISNKLTKYQSFEEFKSKENPTKLNLVKVDEFYEKKKWEASGFEMILVGILSLIVSIFTAVMMHKFIMYGRIFKPKR